MAGLPVPNGDGVRKIAQNCVENSLAVLCLRGITKVSNTSVSESFPISNFGIDRVPNSILTAEGHN
jgi:hypothetical protein